jgi:hypothetical protein
MKIRSINWQIWIAFLLSVIAFMSYPTFFVKFPVTRDFPWANLLLFVIALALAVIGVRRAWSRRKLTRDGDEKPAIGSRILASVLGVLTVVVLSLFILTVFIAARWLPASTGAPKVGQIAPEFRLVDTSNKPVALAELLSSPWNGSNPKGVLLIFYRGYW